MSGQIDKSPEAQRRELDRVGAFSDGVFAVAITLLVLNIEVPNLTGEETLGNALVDLLSSIQAYFIAFAVIGLFWYGHHVAWSRLERSSGKLVAANLLLLSLIGLMPFTTALIGGDYSDVKDEALAVSVYAFNVGLASAADSLMDRIVIRDGLSMPTDPFEQRATLVAGRLRFGIFFASIPIAFLISPTVAQLSWIGLFFTTTLAYRLIGERPQPEPEEPPPS